GLTIVRWQDVGEVVLVTQRIGTRYLLAFKISDAGRRRIISRGHPLIRWWLRVYYRLSANELIFRQGGLAISIEEFAILAKDYHGRYGTAELLDETHL
ncbi:MAG: hypothetical protein AAF267_22475, partial [Deinococcota bacterium]